MFQWYSLNGAAKYFNDKNKVPRDIWMVLCCSVQNQMLKCFDNENSALLNEHSFLDLELYLCEQGDVDLARNVFTIKYNDCMHTFQLKCANQTECWYSRLLTLMGNPSASNKDISSIKGRERTTSGGTGHLSSKSFLQRQLHPGISLFSLDKIVKDSHSPSPVSDRIYSNRTSVSMDLSDDVFNSSISRSIFKGSSDKSLHTVNEGVLGDNDLIYLFDTIRDKANKHMNDMKSELLSTQIDFLENVLHTIVSGNAKDIENRYGRKIKSILESEREENPTLPTFSKLPNISNYVDNYGFKYSLEDDGDIKLICHKLIDVLKLKSQSLNQQVKRLHQYIHSPCVDVDVILENIDNYQHIGFPVLLRKPMWNLLATHHLKKIEFPVLQTNNYFVMLLQQINNIDADIKRIIKVESYKMYSQNIYFDRIDAPKIRNVQNIMMAIYVRNPTYKYSNLLMKISAMAIIILEQAEVFRLLVAISESLIGAKVINDTFFSGVCDQMFLKQLITDRDKTLSEHLLQTNTDISFLTTRWIENIFIDCLPFESSLRIFDVFLIKGQDWIVLICFVIIMLERKKLMVLEKPYDIYKLLTNRYNHMYDIDFILEETKLLESSFPEGYLRKRRSEFHEQSIQTRTSESANSNNSSPIRFQDNSAAFRHIPGKIECTCFNEKYIFIAVARQCNSVIYALNIPKGFKKEKSVKVEFFVSVMVCVKSFLLVASDLGFISCYDNKKGDWLWKIALQNCPLDMAAVEDNAADQLYIGLDNGSIAIIENLSSQTTNSTFHLHLSLHPIYKMVLSTLHLVCATRDCIFIMDTSSITVINRISLQSQPQSIIQDMRLDEASLWLVYKGSTLIQLWNLETCSQIFSQNIALFQGRRIVNGTITIVHPVSGQNQLWIATDTGEMFIFDVKCTMIRETPQYDSDLQLNDGSSWECHQSVVNKVVDYLSSMHSDSPRRLSVAMVESEFVDISIMNEQSKCTFGYNGNDDNVFEQSTNDKKDKVDTSKVSFSNSNSNEEIHLIQRTFLSLKGGMKISDSPIQHICSLLFPNEIGEAFITLSSYMEEENNLVIWKHEVQGWKYKVMHYQSLEKSQTFFSRLLEKLSLPII